MATLLSNEVTDLLERHGIPESIQEADYRLEIAYRIGYADAVRNFATWRNGDQFVGALQRNVKIVLAEFQNAKVPERY